MNPSDRLWSLGAGVLALGVGAGAWFGVISPDLSATDVANDDRESVEHRSVMEELRLAELEQLNGRMGEFASARDELAEGIPSEMEYAEFLRQLDELALDTGVVITAVTQSDALEYTEPVAPEGAVAELAEPAAPADSTASGEGAEASDASSAGSAAGSATSTGATSTGAGAAGTGAGAAGTGATADAQSTTGASGLGAGAPLPYTDPLISNNLIMVPFTVSAEGGDAQLADFLHELQMAKRHVSITTTAITTGAAVVIGAGDASGETREVDETAEAAEPGETAEAVRVDAASGESEPGRAEIAGYLYVLLPSAALPAP